MNALTPEELEELRRADEEIEREFRWTPEELAASRERDREIALDQKDRKARKVAEYQKAYYEANREKVAERKKAYREANREKVAERKKRAALKELRKRAGYTQADLSRLTGISQPMISQYETGAVPFDPSIFASVFPGASWEVPDEP